MSRDNNYVLELVKQAGLVTPEQLDSAKKFVEDFNPDIVFCPRLSSRGLLKVESIVAKFTKAPFVAFTGDNEYSYKLIRFSLESRRITFNSIS